MDPAPQMYSNFSQSMHKAHFKYEVKSSSRQRLEIYLHFLVLQTNGSSCYLNLSEPPKNAWRRCDRKALCHQPPKHNMEAVESAAEQEFSEELFRKRAGSLRVKKWVHTKRAHQPLE
eukprot:6475469-Amphidinium_carterae.4